jgi:hypothetical protein
MGTNGSGNGSKLIQYAATLFVGVVLGAVTFSLSQTRAIAVVENDVAHLKERAAATDAKIDRITEMISQLIIQNSRLISALETQRQTK